MRAQMLAPFCYPRVAGYIAGVDEAGRGPLAGPVVTAAVILDPKVPIAGLADSKSISAQTREALYNQITVHALAWQVGCAHPQEIDQLNILQATLLAMQRAVAGLAITPHYVLVDGNCCPKLPVPVQAVIKGDARVAEISAASIVAKVTRDRAMIDLDSHFPEYGFARHKGYPTVAHLAQLARFGVTPHHRRSFAPIKRLLNGVLSNS